MADRAIGVMGGAFDPIHYGHLVAASEVAERFALDQVVFVPTARPWQKEPASPAEHRYLMTVIATAPDPRFAVSRIELDRPGPTYTVDTLEEMRSDRWRGARLYLITGADVVERLTSWVRYQDVLNLAHVVAVTRPDHELSLGHLPAGSVTVLPIPAVAVSSTQIRGRVAAGHAIDYLVPRAVAAYIGKHRLYG